MNSTNDKPTEQTATVRTSLRYHISGILVLSVIMFYLLDSATDDELLNISSLLEMSEQGYDYFMADVDSFHYLANGDVDYLFQARRVTHFPNPEVSILEDPRFMVFQGNASNWEINAITGRVEMDEERNQERLILNDNVIINGTTANGRPVNITTDTLTIYPEAKSMHSESEVRFESEGIVSSSRGFMADLNTNVIRQLANGRMQYEN